MSQTSTSESETTFQGEQNWRRGAEEIKSAARAAGDTAVQAARDVTSLLGTQASAVASAAREKGEHMVQDRKNWTASCVEQCSKAMESAASSLRENNQAMLADGADRLAQQINHTALYIREHEARAILQDLGAAVKRHPQWFLGGMFLAGLAAARFLKAQRPEHPQPGLDTEDLQQEADEAFSENPMPGVTMSSQSRPASRQSTVHESRLADLSSAPDEAAGDASPKDFPQDEACPPRI